LDSFEPIPPPLPETPVAPLPAPSPTDENPVFNLGDVLIIAVVTFVILFVCESAAVIFASAAHLVGGNVKDVTSNVLVFLPGQVVGYLLCTGFMALLIRQKYHTGFLDAVRWNPPTRRWIYGAIALGAGLGLVNELLSGVLERWIPKSLPIEQLFRNTPSAYALAAFGILLAPLVEELFFRGFLYPALARPLGSALSVALTGGFFALMHSPQLAHAWIPLLLLFAIGVILTVVRAKTKSVATTVIIHMSYNATLFTLLYIGTGGFRHLERM
jgi:uncharacterized protein